MAFIDMQFSYTITAYLSLYPDCEACMVSSTGVIVLLNPCITCGLSSGIPVNIFVSYTMTITFSYPNLVVTPSPCEPQVIYTCTYFSGPYNGPIDMCEFEIHTQGQTCEASFDVLTGDYLFNCYDSDTFPPGIYIFIVTATVGDTSYDITFTLTLVDDCPENSNPSIINDPFLVGPYIYVLQSEVLRLEYDLNIIGGTIPGCGTSAIQFITVNGSTDLPDIFTPDYQNQVLLVGYSADTTHVGEYYLHFKFYFTAHPQVYVTSTVFQVVVINGCSPPIGFPNPITIIPPICEPIIYVIGQPQIDYVLPPWMTNPSHCATDIQIIIPNVIITGQFGSAVTWNGSSIVVYYDLGFDLAGTTSLGITYQVTIEVQLGTLTSSTVIEITIQNPCFNPGFMAIQPVILPTQECIVGSGPCSWVHDDFSLIGSQHYINICGSLTYSIDIDIDTTFGSCLVYDPIFHVITIDCDDSIMVVGTYEYTITVTWSLFPGCGWIDCGSSSVGTIIILTSCTSPVIDIGIIINIDFDFSGPGIWTPPPCTVMPPVCYPEIVYTCIYIGGPYTGHLDLCSFIGSFDITTGVFVFNSND